MCCYGPNIRALGYKFFEIKLLEYRKQAADYLYSPKYITYYGYDVYQGESRLQLEETGFQVTIILGLVTGLTFALYSKTLAKKDIFM